MILNDEFRLKIGLAEMLKGGVIMDVTNPEQAQIAERAGACAVMALERVPSDIRKEGGVEYLYAARPSNHEVVKLKLDVQKHVPAHGRVGTGAEFNAMFAGATKTQ